MEKQRISFAKLSQSLGSLHSNRNPHISNRQLPQWRNPPVPGIMEWSETLHRCLRRGLGPHREGWGG